MGAGGPGETGLHQFNPVFTVGEKPFGNTPEASSKSHAFCVAHALICDSQGLYLADDSEYGRICDVAVSLRLIRGWGEWVVKGELASVMGIGSVY